MRVNDRNQSKVRAPADGWSIRGRIGISMFALAASLGFASAAATAMQGPHVEIEVMEAGRFGGQWLSWRGRPGACGHTWVAIYGSNVLKVSDMHLRSLRLGSRAYSGARLRGHVKWDLNDDGDLDLLARFRTVETGLRGAEQRDAVGRGALKDDHTIFTAYHTSFGVSEDDPSTYCDTVSSDAGDLLGARCTFTSSLAPLDFSDLIYTLNSSIAANGIGDGSAVVAELWGGKGHDGGKEGGSFEGYGGSRAMRKRSRRCRILKRIFISTSGRTGRTISAGGRRACLSGRILCL